MDDLQGKIEAILFMTSKPLPLKHLAHAVGADEATVRTALGRLAEERNASPAGVHLLVNGDDVQLVTNPAYAAIVEAFVDDERDPELTRPSVEALTIVAYRGPVTKPEIEAIRGVNCSLIVRNLLMRGLIVEREDTVKMQSVYTLSADALRFFGVHRVEELPDYEDLHTNAKIAQLLAALTAPETAAAASSPV